jgi:hypothetical protein
VLAERERVRPVRPTLEEIQHYLGGAPFASWTDQARRFATSETLEPKSHKSYLRTVLLQLDHRPHGLERRRSGVSWQKLPNSARPELDHPRAAMSAG